MNYSVIPTLAVVMFMTVASVITLAWNMRGLIFDLDPGDKHSFHAFFYVYRQVYGVIFVAGVALSMLVPSADAKLLLSLSAIYALVFVLWLTFCYERYQHTRYRQDSRGSYSGWRYAVTLTWGAMSPALFALGLLIGVINV